MNKIVNIKQHRGRNFVGGKFAEVVNDLGEFQYAGTLHNCEQYVLANPGENEPEPITISVKEVKRVSMLPIQFVMEHMSETRMWLDDGTYFLDLYYPDPSRSSFIQRVATIPLEDGEREAIRAMPDDGIKEWVIKNVNRIKEI